MLPKGPLHTELEPRVSVMSFAILGMALSAAGERTPLAELDYRLPRPQYLRDACRTAGEDEIVVCGRRDQDRFRVHAVAPPRGMVLRRPSPFEWDLGGGARAGLDISQVLRPDGFVDYRVMIGIRIPF